MIFMLDELKKILGQDREKYNFPGPSPVHSPLPQKEVSALYDKISAADGQADLSWDEAHLLMRAVVFEAREFLLEILKTDNHTGSPEIVTLKQRFINKTPDLMRNGMDGACIVASTFIKHKLMTLGINDSIAAHSCLLKELDLDIRPKDVRNHGFHLVSLKVEGQERTFIIDPTYAQFCAETIRLKSDVTASGFTYVRKAPDSLEPGRLLSEQTAGHKSLDFLLQHGFSYWGKGLSQRYLRSFITKPLSADQKNKLDITVDKYMAGCYMRPATTPYALFHLQKKAAQAPA